MRRTSSHACRRAAGGFRRTLRFRVVAAAAGGALVGATLVLAMTSSAGASTQTFTSNGTFVVPAGVTSVNVVLTGAPGGDCGSHLQGLGAVVTATLPVTPGANLNIYLGTYGGGIGGAGGTDGAQAGQTADGGAGGSPDGPSIGGSGGGAASDIREGGTALSNRIAVAEGTITSQETVLSLADAAS